MLLDKENLFSDAQTVLVTAYSTNVIKFGKYDVSYVPVIVQVAADFVGHTSVEVQVETSETSSFSSYTTLASYSIPVNKMVKGAVLPIAYLPKGNLGYMRLKYVVTGTGTAGKIIAGVVAANDISYHDCPST